MPTAAADATEEDLDRGMGPAWIGRSLRATVAVLLAAALLPACAASTDGGAGGAPGPTTQAPSAAPTDPPAGALDVHGAESAEPPPRDAELMEADWPQTAAWIARAADDGQPVVVNFFASWCGPCKREAPLLEQARTNHPGVAFLGIAYRDFKPEARSFLEDTGLQLPTLADFDGSVGAEMGVRGMPNTFFFDASGRLRAHELGELNEQTLQARIREITS